jgi:hypothetical protein
VAVTLSCILLVSRGAPARAQSITHRGFVEGVGYGFPQTTLLDHVHLVGDLLAREEVFVRPAPWLRLAAGLELRANSHDQVDESWAVRFRDRTARRPRLTMRTLAASLTKGAFTLEAGKQFIRWGKTDIVVPTDRFGPRDYLTLVEAPFLAVTGVRGTAQRGGYTVEAVWVPRLTPSRIPLLDQRWAGRAVEAAAPLTIVEGPPAFPGGAQAGIRVGHAGDRLEYSASFYDGFNHLPNFQVTGTGTPSQPLQVERVYPSIRTYGADTVIPMRWFTLKAEGAFFSSSSPMTDEYILYVLQLERQRGEWVFVGGYAGEAITEKRSLLGFAPDRGLSRSIVARASYTIDANRGFELEAAVRQNGDGVYAKAEYSQARGQHWRATFAGVLLTGEEDDFIGQYNRNSHLRLTLRYSF